MKPDVIVVGLGAAGAATLHELARRGARVLGIDSHHPPHAQGSSHGETRITREAIGEGDVYVPLARRSHELWRRIAAESGGTLMQGGGLVIIGRLDLPAVHAGKPDFLRRTLNAAEAFGIPHAIIDPTECRRRFTQLQVADSEAVYFEPGAGMLFPERCIAAQLDLARRHGAEVRTDERVRAIEPQKGGVRVITATGTFEAGQVVVAAGAWTPGLLGGAYRKVLKPYRQAMLWFEAEDPATFDPERSPVFIWMHGAEPEDWFYGFPRMPGETSVKVAAERFDAPLESADDLDPAVSPAEADFVWSRHIEGRVKGLKPDCVRASACLYTMAPDSRFVIGRDPEHDRVIVVSACSGHGFKHSPAIGEAVASLALDGMAPDILAPFDPALALAAADGR